MIVPTVVISVPTNLDAAILPASIALVTLYAPIVVVIAVVPLPETSPDNVIVWFAVKYEVLEADVTNPFAFTVTLLNVPMLLFTVARVSTVAPVASPVCVALLTNPEYKLFTALSPVFVPLKFATAPLASMVFVIAPAAIEVVIAVVPEPVTTPLKVIVWFAVKYEVLEADVTNPFAFTVTLLNVPMLLFTVARVSTVAPVASPVCVALLTNPEYKLFTALSPVFVPERFATAPLASIAFVIAPAAIEVALPTLVTTPVKFALVVTVLALPVNAPMKVVDVTEVSPAKVVDELPKLIAVVPIVTFELTSMVLVTLPAPMEKTVPDKVTSPVYAATRVSTLALVKNKLVLPSVKLSLLSETKFLYPFQYFFVVYGAVMDASAPKLFLAVVIFVTSARLLAAIIFPTVQLLFTDKSNAVPLIVSVLV